MSQDNSPAKQVSVQPRCPGPSLPEKTMFKQLNQALGTLEDMNPAKYRGEPTD